MKISSLAVPTLFLTSLLTLTGCAQKSPSSNGNAELMDHDVYISFSNDPASFSSGTLVTESASVPDVLVCTIDSAACSTGEIIVYFVDPINETNAMEGVSLIRSTDGGKTWSERQSISIAEKINKGPAVDPSVVQLEDGSIRIYYYGPDKPMENEPIDEKEKRSVYSAISEDGLNFTQEEGIRLSAINLTDPEVTKMNETWFLYYSVGQNSGVATSADGLIFEDRGEMENRVGGVPGAMTLEGGMRIYGCSLGGIVTSFAADGLLFPEATENLFTQDIKGVCDPAVSAYKNGYVLIYKVVDR